MPEIGLTTAPLTSAAYYYGSACDDYNQDFMQCKNENGGDPRKCKVEGERVTNFERLKQNCQKEFECHWECLSNNNMEYVWCRKEEKRLSECVFDKMKEIPGAPKEETPIYSREKTYYP